jgi:hypothetical protein
VRGVAGVVLVLIALFIVGPIGLFVVGATWSAIGAWLLSEDAAERHGEAA